MPAPVVEIAVGGGIDRERLVGAAPGQELTEADVTVHPVPPCTAWAATSPWSMSSRRGGDGGPVRFLGYAVEIGGVRFFHAGDGLALPRAPRRPVRAGARRADAPHQRP